MISRTLILLTTTLIGACSTNGQTDPIPTKDTGLYDSNVEIWTENLDALSGNRQIVAIRFKEDRNGDVCPKSTQPRQRKSANSDEDQDHCKIPNGLKQADALCVGAGKQIFFKAKGRHKRKFTLAGKNTQDLPFTSCDEAANVPSFTKLCTVKEGIRGEFSYLIKTDTCELDPRFIINDTIIK